MIAEVTLALVVLGLLGLLVWEKHENKKERAKLFNALIAKTPEQFRDLELTEKVQPIKPPTNQEPDLVPESEVDDKTFRDLVEKEVE